MIHICSNAEAFGQAGLLRWEYSHYLGPTFLKKNGEPTAHQPPSPAAWKHFYIWLAEHKKTCTTCLREAAEDPEREAIRDATIKEYIDDDPTILRDVKRPTQRHGARGPRRRTLKSP